MGKIRLVVIFGAMVSLAGEVGAETITKPHNFTSGTTIRSSQVNENFDVLYQRINEMQQQIDRLRSYHIPTDGLVAYYPFNGNAIDESGNENDGTVNGAVLAADRFGNIDRAVSFDGIDDSINLPYTNTTDEITISYWFKANLMASSTTAGMSLFSMFQDNHGAYGMAWTLNDTMYFNSYTSDWDTVYTDSEVDLTGKWHHIVFTRNSSGVGDLYINNNLIKTSPLSAPSGDYPDIGSQTIVGGGSKYNNWLNGYFDDLLIYNRALSTSEITQLFIQR